MMNMHCVLSCDWMNHVLKEPQVFVEGDKYGRSFIMRHLIITCLNLLVYSIVQFPWTKEHIYPSQWGTFPMDISLWGYG